jgi:hypothetical protein
VLEATIVFSLSDFMSSTRRAFGRLQNSERAERNYFSSLTLMPCSLRIALMLMSIAVMTFVFGLALQ